MQMAYWHPLLPTALHKDEALPKKEDEDKTTLEKERDEAMEKLNEFQLVSQMVIEEVSAIQEDLEIERLCRESAEALASKLKRENRSLKRKSMMMLSYLSPETIIDINLDEEERAADDDEEEQEPLGSSNALCISACCSTAISGLQDKLEATLKEKNQLISDLDLTRQQLKNNCDELMKVKQSNTILTAEFLQQKRLLEKYNRVSQFAVEEYEALQQTLDLEQNLRTEAESFAREMLVEQKKLKRQSQLLLQSSTPSQALQDALSQVAVLKAEMERQRLEHHNQLKQMEEKLNNCETQKEITALRQKLVLLEEEKKESSTRCFKAEQELKDLKITVETLQKKLQAVTNPPLAPPPPPPPLPPSAPEAPSNPLSSLLALIRKRRNISNDVPLVEQHSVKTSDIRHQAVEEMMQRIKRGIQLRPVNQSPNRNEPKMERLPSNSAIQELKGIMENFNKARPPPKAVPPSVNPDEELQRILLRRRDALNS
ncbi:shootin-1 isoform X2 [Cyprinodon tularosa]|uniref:shootin-1 isoform X2 n=1 Tax=Cyprinodon tularosa TaxID=77115 RepID=UPI0018E1F8A7|nr:shootin-1 isoform X2 [Cyprinodon tularosa]